MKVFVFSIYLLFCLSLISCGGHSHGEKEYTPEEQKILNQAAEIHNEATKFYEDISPQKEEAKALIKKLEEKDSQKFAKDIAKLKTVLEGFENWEKEIIEVPGNDHEHNHEGHHHHHAPTVEVSVEDMLQIQKEMLANVQKLSKKLDTAIEDAKSKIKGE